MVKESLSVVIPIYNEQDNIEKVYDELKTTLNEIKNKLISSYEIIFINDGSRDKTQLILERLKSKEKNMKIIEFRKNFGQTAALKAGFDYCNGNIIVTMDGDLQNDPKDIPRLIEKLNKGYDVVSGWRYKRRDKFFKKISSRVMNNIRKSVIGDQLHDYGCSLKIYKKQAIKDLELSGELHRYITAYLYIKGYKIGEIPVSHRKRKYGKTKYTFKRGLNGILDLFFLKFWSSYSNRPLHFFGRLGFYQWILSGLIVVEQIIKAYIVGELFLGPLLMVAFILGITGLLFIIFGFLFEVMIRNYFLAGNIKVYNIKKIS